LLLLACCPLQDDKRYFPPYEAVPIVREETLKRYPTLAPAIAGLKDLITADEMRRLNYAVEGELRDVKEVVREFLQSRQAVIQGSEQLVPGS
jgi:osmoprotectant transport system substrate-binding protein